MNFSRKTILVVGAALLAACGDKVTVHEVTPPVDVPKVNSVEVTPGTATLNIGQTITMTAAVNADVGLATTVTWSSSDATKASVSTAGVVTAVAATPGVAICAASTVDAGKKGCATVVVTPATQTIPATILINSITKAGLNIPVNVAGFGGQFDVTLNVNPGNQTISKIELLVGGKVAGTQTFSAAQSAALRYSADEAVAAQTSNFPQIVFSVNSADYNTSTGAVTWLNGNQVVQAKLYTSGTTAATASASQNLVFANADGFHITWSNTGTPGSAVDALGYRWNGGGSLTVNALPVMYSGATVGSVTTSLGVNGACTALGTVGTATSATAGVFVTTGTLAGLQSAAVCATTSPNLVAVTAKSPAGENLTLTAGGVVNVQTGIRWDNLAPAAPAGSTFGAVAAGNAANIRINVNPNSRANGWINDAVVLNGAATTATSNNFLCQASAAGFNTCLATDTLPRDAGVGGAVYSVQVGATKAAAYAAAPITSAASLAATVTNADYCAIAFSTDALGNKTTLTTAQQATACGAEVNSALIGVDRAAPTISYTVASIAANARIAGTAPAPFPIGGNFTVTVNDTGLVGNSGMLPTAPVKMTLSRRAAGAVANSAGTTTLLAADGATVVTALSATGVAAAAPAYSTSIAAISGVANYAYWTHNATAYDAAGNSASVSPRTMVYDATAPVPGAPSTAVSLAATGYTANAFISEDLDIQDFSFGVTYGALAPFTSAAANLQMPMVAVNGFNAATFANTNYGVNAAVPMPLALQANVAAAPLTNMAGLYTLARSQTNLSAQSGNFVPGVVTPGAVIPSGAPQLTTFPAVAITTAALTPASALPATNGLVTGNTTAASATATGPFQTNATLTATITGSTAVFNNPFSRIDFYMKDATGTRYFNVGSASVASLNDNGVTRTFTFTTTINGPTVYALLGGAGASFTSDIVAVGIGAANSNIGMVAAGASTINVVF